MYSIQSIPITLSHIVFIMQKPNKSLTFVLILMCFALYVEGQNRYFEWVNLKDGYRERLEIDNEQVHLKEIKPGKFVSSNPIQIEPSALRDLPPNFGNNFFYTDQKKIWFTLHGTGQVYQFEPSKNTFSRLDKTYYKGHNFEASQFIRKDTLYNFGGYGFWNYTNVITYYDSIQKEWQVVRPENSGPESLVGGYQGYSLADDKFYSGAAEHEPVRKNINKTIEDVIYAFDFKELKWSILGKINPDLPFKSQRSIYWDGEHFIQWSADKLYLIDPAANKVYCLDDPKKYYQANDKFYRIGDTIYSYWTNKTTIVKLSKKELLKQAKRFGEFYTKPIRSISTFILTALAMGLLGFAIFGIYKKRKSGTRSHHWFDAIELELLNRMTLLEDSEDKQLSVIQINEILNIEHKAPDNQRRIRMKFFKDINTKLLIHFKVEEAIERIQSDEDKRLLLYRLKPAIQQKLVEYGIGKGSKK